MLFITHVLGPFESSPSPQFLEQVTQMKLRKVVHLIVSVPHYRNVAHLKLKFHQKRRIIYND